MKLMKEVEMSIAQFNIMTNFIGFRMTDEMSVVEIRDRLQQMSDESYAKAKEAEELCSILNKHLNK